MNLLTLTTSESLSRYIGSQASNVWSDLKHVRAHEHGKHSDPKSKL